MLLLATTSSAKERPKGRFVAENVTKLTEDVVHRRTAGTVSARSTTQTRVAKLIVPGPLVIVAQYVVGLRSFLESSFRVGRLGDVRMVLTRKFAIGLLDLLQVGLNRQAQRCVVVLVLHAKAAATATQQTIGRVVIFM